MSRTYDTDGKIYQISSGGLKTYSHDDAFRITGITDTETGASNWSYGYDLLDRLDSASGGGNTYGWTYDANGNRLTQTGTFASTYHISATNNQITSITGYGARSAYGYDSAGNMPPRAMRCARDLGAAKAALLDLLPMRSSAAELLTKNFLRASECWHFWV